MRSLYTFGFLYIGLSLYALLIKPAPEMTPTTTAVADFTGDAGQWFQAVKPYCNSVEAEMIHKRIPPPKADIERLLSSTCEAASDLAQLEQGLSVLEGHVDGSTDAADCWRDGLALAERTRDALVQKFLDGLTLLTRVRSDIARSSAEQRQLVELLADIEAHAEAQHEVEALVAEVGAG